MFSIYRTGFQTSILLLFLSLSHFCVDIMLGIWPIYKSIAQLNLAQAGLVAASGAFIGEGAQLFFGPLSDRGYRKHLILIGLLISSANAFLAYVTETAPLFALYLLTCIGSGCFHPAASGLVNSLSKDHKGLFMGIFSATGALGLAFSQLIFFIFYESFEGMTGLIAIPALFLFIGLASLSFRQASLTQTKKIPLNAVFSFFKMPALRFLYIAQVAGQSIMWGTIFILPDALKAFGHSNEISYGIGHLVFILGAACMMIPAGYLSDKYSARSVLTVAGLIGFGSFYFFIFCGSYSSVITLVTLFSIGASIGVINPVGVSMGVKLVPDRPSAVSAFLMGMVWCVAECIGPGGVGVLSSLFEGAFAPIKALSVLGSLFLVQIIAIAKLPHFEETALSKEPILLSES